MRLGLGLSPSAGAFTPASLFAAGEAGAFYDVSDPSSMFQDSAGTTAAVVGQPVGYITDKSGRGNHAIQATTAAKPILRQDGSGNYYLEHDGVDDWLRALFTIAQPWDRVSAIQQISWTASDYVFGGGNADAGRLYQTGTTPNLSIYDSGGLAVANNGLAVGVNGVVTEGHNGSVSSRIAVNNGAYATGTPGTTLPGGLTIGATHGGGGPGNIRFYGVCMIGRALTDAEITSLRTFMASKSGVTL